MPTDNRTRDRAPLGYVTLKEFLASYATANHISAACAYGRYARGQIKVETWRKNARVVFVKAPRA